MSQSCTDPIKVYSPYGIPIKVPCMQCEYCTSTLRISNPIDYRKKL